MCDCAVIFPAVLRVAGALQKSTDVMKAMQSLVKIPEIQGTMRELSKEMMKVSHISADTLWPLCYCWVHKSITAHVHCSIAAASHTGVKPSFERLREAVQF